MLLWQDVLRMLWVAADRFANLCVGRNPFLWWRVFGECQAVCASGVPFFCSAVEASRVRNCARVTSSVPVILYAQWFILLGAWSVFVPHSSILRRHLHSFFVLQILWTYISLLFCSDPTTKFLSAFIVFKFCVLTSCCTRHNHRASFQNCSHAPSFLNFSLLQTIRSNFVLGLTPRL